MKFYQSIASYYDLIFPANPVQSEFVSSCIEAPLNSKNVLDIGCGTGSLTLELANIFDTISGIELDGDMLQIAKSKDVERKVEFTQLNMLEIDTHYSENKFDTIICFGNTLVHLDGVNQIKEFLVKAKKCLKPNGKLLLQILNYDYILETKLKNLPLIENEFVKFERYYKYDNTNKIKFNTILTIKESKLKIENEIELFPIVKQEINDLLQQLGFETINIYSSFKKNNFQQEAIPLVIEAY